MTFASAHCVPATGASVIDNIAGLPGPGRRVLTGVLTDDGTDDPATCPTRFAFIPTTRGRVLDAGWTGVAHGAQIVSASKVTLAVSGCAGTAPSCGVCTLGGPVLNPNAVP